MHTLSGTPPVSLHVCGFLTPSLFPLLSLGSVSPTVQLTTATFADQSALEGVFTGAIVVSTPSNESTLQGYQLYLANVSSVNVSDGDVRYVVVSTRLQVTVAGCCVDSD